MAHDFGIRNTKKREFAYFFGYANGLMYKAFGDQKHDMGLSGDNKTELKTREETIKALDCAIEKFDKMGYPDDTRMDDIKEFRRSMENDPLTDTYEVWYS